MKVYLSVCIPPTAKTKNLKFHLLPICTNSTTSGIVARAAIKIPGAAAPFSAPVRTAFARFRGKLVAALLPLSLFGIATAVKN